MSLTRSRRNNHSMACIAPTAGTLQRQLFSTDYQGLERPHRIFNFPAEATDDCVAKFTSLEGALGTNFLNYRSW